MRDEHFVQTLSFITIENDSGYSLKKSKSAQQSYAAGSRSLVVLAQAAAGNVALELGLQLALCAGEGGVNRNKWSR